MYYVLCIHMYVLRIMYTYVCVGICVTGCIPFTTGLEVTRGFCIVQAQVAPNQLP